MRNLLLAGIVVIGFSLLFSLAFAQEAVSPANTTLPSPTPVEYTLPYPGILPDHPLFFLKVLRDRILLLFISNPLRKVEFYILMADKDAGMGQLLMEKQKQVLAVKTLGSGVENLAKAEKLIFDIQLTSSNSVANIKHQLGQSMLKHQEVIHGFTQQADNDRKTELTRLTTTLNSLLDDFSRRK